MLQVTLKKKSFKAWIMFHSKSEKSEEAVCYR